MTISGLLLACQNNQAVDNIQSVNDKNENINHNTITNQSKPLTIDEQLALIAEDNWQFVKAENVIDDNLKLLNETVSISFVKAKEQSEMTDPDFDINYQYYLSANANCNSNSTVIGFDKHSNKIVEVKGMDFSTLVGCHPDLEQLVKDFIYSNKTTYHLNQDSLSFSDDNNQTLHFKKSSKNKDNIIKQLNSNHPWQWYQSDNTNNTPLSVFDNHFSLFFKQIENDNYQLSYFVGCEIKTANVLLDFNKKSIELLSIDSFNSQAKNQECALQEKSLAFENFLKQNPTFSLNNHGLILKNQQNQALYFYQDKQKIADKLINITNNEHIWRFKRSQHIKNPILNELDGRVLLIAKKSGDDEYKELTQLNPSIAKIINKNDMYTLSINNHCTYRGVYVVFDKSLPKIKGTNTRTAQNAVACPNDALDNALLEFLNGELVYHLDNDELTLTDNHNQSLVFEQEIIYDEYKTALSVVAGVWQFFESKNIQDEHLKHLNANTTIRFYKPKKPIDKTIKGDSRFRYVVSSTLGCDSYHSDILFGNHLFELNNISNVIHTEKSKHCQNNEKSHNALHQFILNNNGYYLNGGYFLKDKNLVLIDHKNQTLIFKFKEKQ